MNNSFTDKYTSLSHRCQVFEGKKCKRDGCVRSSVSIDAPLLQDDSIDDSMHTRFLKLPNLPIMEDRMSSSNAANLPLPDTLADTGRYNRERFGEYVSLIYEFPGQERTYTNLDVDREANKLGNALMHLGVKKGIG